MIPMMEPEPPVPPLEPEILVPDEEQPEDKVDHEPEIGENERVLNLRMR